MLLRIKLLLVFLFLCLVKVGFPTSVFAREGQVLGVHLLSPRDLPHAQELLSKGDDWKFVTVPLTFEDLNHKQEWQQFFYDAREAKFRPIIRLATKFENGAWVVPNKRQIVQMFEFLDELEWPNHKLYVIAFNEVNHAPEWGNKINPAEYARILEFTARWAHTNDKEYIVMPAALDLAAPNGTKTMEAFNYLEKMWQYNPQIFDYIDVWNSHSYPNPGFSSSPTRTAKNSIRGFLHELSYLKRKTGRDFDVMITETGWEANRSTTPWLESYYLYALQHVWSHPQVIGVTPFVVKGAPGPFAGFSFFDGDDRPTVQYDALQKALEKM